MGPDLAFLRQLSVVGALRQAGSPGGQAERRRHRVLQDELGRGPGPHREDPRWPSDQAALDDQAYSL